MIYNQILKLIKWNIFNRSGGQLILIFWLIFCLKGLNFCFFLQGKLILKIQDFLINHKSYIYIANKIYTFKKWKLNNLLNGKFPISFGGGTVDKTKQKYFNLKPIQGLYIYIDKHHSYDNSISSSSSSSLLFYYIQYISPHTHTQSIFR